MRQSRGTVNAETQGDDLPLTRLQAGTNKGYGALGIHLAEYFLGQILFGRNNIHVGERIPVPINIYGVAERYLCALLFPGTEVHEYLVLNALCPISGKACAGLRSESVYRLA